MARVWDFIGLLAQFDLGLLTQNMARRPDVIRIDVIWYYRIDDYFRVFLGVEKRYEQAWLEGLLGREKQGAEEGTRQDSVGVHSYQTVTGQGFFEKVNFHCSKTRYGDGAKRAH
jgi:hypothetical protein